MQSPVILCTPLLQSFRIPDVFRGRRPCYCHQADHLRLAAIVLKLFPEASSPRDPRDEEDSRIWRNPIQRSGFHVRSSCTGNGFRLLPRKKSFSSACKVAPYAEKLRDPRVANMLKVRAKTLLEYKEATSEIIGAYQFWGTCNRHPTIRRAIVSTSHYHHRNRPSTRRVQALERAPL